LTLQACFSLVVKFIDEVLLYFQEEIHVFRCKCTRSPKEACDVYHKVVFSARVLNLDNNRAAIEQRGFMHLPDGRPMEWLFPEAAKVLAKWTQLTFYDLLHFRKT